MNAGKLGFVPREQKTSVIKIHSYRDKNPEGVLLNPYYKEERPFRNLTQLLLLIESLQDTLCYPQKSMESRSFKKENGEAESAPDFTPAAATQTAEALATFKINILFRQNASWQGSIVWVEKAMESQFRSALELIMLVDSVLS